MEPYNSRIRVYSIWGINIYSIVLTIIAIFSLYIAFTVKIMLISIALIFFAIIAFTAALVLYITQSKLIFLKDYFKSVRIKKNLEEWSGF